MKTALAIAALVALTGCATNQQTGMLAGAAVGAATGKVLDGQSGAAVGAVLGAAAGGDAGVPSPCAAARQRHKRIPTRLQASLTKLGNESLHHPVFFN